MPQPKRHWFKSKWTLAVTAVLCLLVTVSFVKELIRSYRINQEIAQLKDEIDQLQDRNKKTTSFVEYLKTDAYFQEQARLKLGLKQQGEKVIVLEPSDATTTQTAQSPSAKSRSSQQPYGNPSRWLTYFFGGK